MKLSPPKILVRVLDMTAYAPEFETQLHVWANPPSDFIVQWDEIKFACEDKKKTAACELFNMPEDATATELNSSLKEARIKETDGYTEWLKRGELYTTEKINQQIIWASELWSQGIEETRLSVEELTRFVDAIKDTDPALFAWMISQSLEIIRKHRQDIKKN